MRIPASVQVCAEDADDLRVIRVPRARAHSHTRTHAQTSITCVDISLAREGSDRIQKKSPHLMRLLSSRRLIGNELLPAAGSCILIHANIVYA